MLVALHFLYLSVLSLALFLILKDGNEQRSKLVVDTRSTDGFPLLPLCLFSTRTHANRGARTAQRCVRVLEDRVTASTLTKRSFLTHRLSLGMHLKSVPGAGSACRPNPATGLSQPVS